MAWRFSCRKSALGSVVVVLVRWWFGPNPVGRCWDIGTRWWSDICTIFSEFHNSVVVVSLGVEQQKRYLYLDGGGMWTGSTAGVAPGVPGPRNGDVVTDSGAQVRQEEAEFLKSVCSTSENGHHAHQDSTPLT